MGTTTAFKQLPLTAKVAIALTFNNAWWSIEEFVIDRHGVWRYMPGYRVADPCVWDLAVACLTVAGLWWLARRPDKPSAGAGGAMSRA